MQGKFLPNKEEQKKFNIVLGNSDAVELTKYIKFIKEKHDCDLTQAEIIGSVKFVVANLNSQNKLYTTPPNNSRTEKKA
jgi:hypothetical protein